MKKDDIFIGTTQKTLEEGVEYWKNRSYKPNWKDAVKWHIYKTFLCFPRKNAMLVIGSRMTAFLAENTKNFDVISMERGAFTKEELRQNHIGLMPINYWYWKVLCAMEKKDEKKADKYLNDMAKVMRRMRAQAVVLCDLLSAQQKSLAYAARLADVPVVMYQHASVTTVMLLGDSLEYNRNVVSKFADYFWFWSRNSMLDNIRLGVSKPDNSTVIGYPYYYDIRREIPKDKKKLLFVGTGAFYGEDAPTLYSTVEKIYLFCKETGIDFIYRMHPKEYSRNTESIERLKGMGMKISSNTMREDLNNQYIVVGTFSSVIWEAAMYGNFVIQYTVESKQEKICAFQKMYFLEDAYQVKTAEEANDLIMKAATGELAPKEFHEDNLMYGNLTELTKEAMDKIKEDRKRNV